MQIVLRVPANCDSVLYHEDIRDSFLESYKKENNFQMSMQGLGTGTWLLDGRVKFKKAQRLRTARERIRGILLKCHNRLGFSDAANQAFSEYLGQTANLTAKKDCEPFAEGGHRWIVEGSSGEPNAQGEPLHFLHISSSLT